MGQNISCDVCKAEHSYYLVSFRHIDIDDFVKLNSVPISISILDNDKLTEKGHMKPNVKLEDIFPSAKHTNFAEKFREELEDSTGGKVSISWYNGTVHIKQYLCDECFSLGKFKNLNSEWQWEYRGYTNPLKRK